MRASFKIGEGFVNPKYHPHQIRYGYLNMISEMIKMMIDLNLDDDDKKMVMIDPNWDEADRQIKSDKRKASDMMMQIWY